MYLLNTFNFFSGTFSLGLIWNYGNTNLYRISLARAKWNSNKGCIDQNPIKYQESAFHFSLASKQFHVT